jgi:hypothetical protein
MTQITLNTLVQPWRKFPQILGIYAAIWLVGAATLTFIHITFPEKAISPQAPSLENKPSHESEPSPDSKAWKAALASNDANELHGFISEFPNSQYAMEARRRIDELEQQAKMQLADANVNPQIIAQMLENKDTDPALLDKFIASRGLVNKYPLGFALLYSDGRKTLYRVVNVNKDVQFDPATIRGLRLTEEYFCFSGFSAIVKKSQLNMDQNCVGTPVGTVLQMMSFNGVSVIAESLGGSAAGAAWIIGLAP